jgi:hypothetical protein
MLRGTNVFNRNSTSSLRRSIISDIRATIADPRGGTTRTSLILGVPSLASVRGSRDQA